MSINPSALRSGWGPQLPKVMLRICDAVAEMERDRNMGNLDGNHGIHANVEVQTVEAIEFHSELKLAC